jgi:hypothetical protein
MAARFSASMNVPPPVRHDGVALGQQRPDHLPLDRAEVRLSLAGKNIRHRSPLARLDECSRRRRPPSEAARQRLRQSCLSSSHEPDQIDFVRLQEGLLATRADAATPMPRRVAQRFQRGEELGIRNGDRVGAADDRWRVRAERGNRKGHRQPMVSGGIGPSRRADGASPAGEIRR